MKLFYAETINPRKACAVARYLNVPIDYVHVDLGKGENRTPEYLAVNPNGKVPAFEDGDLKLWEANAIMCHLAQAAGSDLWPSDARQIEVIRWLSWNSGISRGMRDRSTSRTSSSLRSASARPTRRR